MADKQDDVEVQTIDFANKALSEDFVQFYANFAECGFTPWDMRLQFAQSGDTGLTKMATVIMTPQMAKALIGLLNTNVRLYEQDNGEIKMPESLVRQVEAQKAKAKAEAEADSEPKPE